MSLTYMDIDAITTWRRAMGVLDDVRAEGGLAFLKWDGERHSHLYTVMVRNDALGIDLGRQDSDALLPALKTRLCAYIAHGGLQNASLPMTGNHSDLHRSNRVRRDSTRDGIIGGSNWTPDEIESLQTWEELLGVLDQVRSEGGVVLLEWHGERSRNPYTSRIGNSNKQIELLSHDSSDPFSASQKALQSYIRHGGLHGPPQCDTTAR